MARCVRVEMGEDCPKKIALTRNHSKTCCEKWPPAFEVVAKGPEKKGTTEAQSTQRKRQALPGAFVVQGFYAVCDTLIREEDEGWYCLSFNLP